MSRSAAYSPAIDVMVDGFDAYDPWGSAMSMAFALADVCEAVGLTVARDVLDYRPSPYADTPELEEMASALDDPQGYSGDTSLEAALLSAAYLQGTVTDADLHRAARVLDRYLNLCKLAGKDY